MQDSRFNPDPERIISEQFESESVVVNLETGAYYSFRGTAALCWNWLTDGASPAAIANRLATGNEAARAEVSEFVNALLAEGLLAANPEAPVPLPVQAVGPVAYEAPRFEKFTDMEDLLLLDPIHDVAPSGWPMVMAEGTPVDTP